MVSIVEVTTKAQLRRFVDYPNQLYRGVPQFVPATYGDDLSDWDRQKNPAFSYCDARCWLAERDGEIVGRIGAIRSRKANEKWGTNRMRFTQVDFIDDPEVSAALFAAVENWARELGCTAVHGPLGFTDMDREGMLVEGFDRRSCFFTYYNHPYYIDHMAALGYVKDVDWIEELITVPTDEKTIQRWEKLSDFVLKRNHLHITTCFVMDKDDRMVAFGVGAPSLATAMQKHRGRLFPTGWVDVLKSFRKNDTIDLLLIAVHPDYQSRGVNAVILSKAMKGCLKMGIKQAETGPMLEMNDKVQSQWKDFQTEQHKRRRCFIKELVPAAAEAETENAPAGAAV